VIRSSELLTELSIDELEALADSLLAPSAQARLDHLLACKREQSLTQDELVEMDRLSPISRSTDASQDESSLHAESIQNGSCRNMSVYVSALRLLALLLAVGQLSLPSR